MGARLPITRAGGAQPATVIDVLLRFVWKNEIRWYIIKLCSTFYAVQLSFSKPTISFLLYSCAQYILNAQMPNTRRLRKAKPRTDPPAPVGKRVLLDLPSGDCLSDYPTMTPVAHASPEICFMIFALLNKSAHRKGVIVYQRKKICIKCIYGSLISNHKSMNFVANNNL